MGALITTLDRTLNRPPVPRAAGVAALFVLLAATILPCWGLQHVLGRSPPGVIALVVLAGTLFASRSLARHVAAVGRALACEGLAGGRIAVSQIVGRNPDMLDETGVVRAAIESLAENFSDGVVAPAVWCALAGLPGIAAYKAVNTADSMIGHRTPRHEAFGWAAARLDDVLNLPASRLAALWLILAALVTRGTDASAALRAVLRDARHHRSPNAGWPEAAMAGALGVRIGGPRVYGTTRADVAWMGDGRDVVPADLDRALTLYRRACAIQIAAIALLSALL
jgi:adenosylcobinamide-phosphate synthase